MADSDRTIVWFRRDLRIDDNLALVAAAREGSVLPIFIWCPADYGQYYPGRCSRWWLKESLVHLGKSLESLGCPLMLIRAESTLAALLECVHSIGATRVVYNRLYDPISIVCDDKIKNELSALGISVHSFNGDILYEPWEVYDENGQAFTTFSMYWENCMNLSIEISLSRAPWSLVPVPGLENVRGCSIDDLGLESSKDEESSNALLSRAWSPGWRNAEKMLEEFVSYGLLEYSKHGMKAGGTTTSLLSPYLHFGELSVRKVYQLVKTQQVRWENEGRSEAEESLRLFLRSIGFREYSRYLCFNFPFTHERSLLGNLKHYPWRANEDHFKSWRQGMTGYPLVDAGMRELWATGWTHNRIRVIVSSFAVKFLQIPWVWGMKYFWDVLLDADLESDILGWQYISGSLPDGHELSRLDNPEVQGQKYDPDGEYVRTWIPELARMPTEWIHRPWDAPSSILEVAGVELGFNYPKPIVELHMARECLDDAISTMWQLDTAAKLAELNGEVVEDNMNNIKSFDIPKVVLKKELSPATSPFDQRASTNGKNQKLQPKEVKGPYKQIVRVDVMNSSKMEDTGSTANSQVSRKRSSSDSAFNVSLCSSSLGVHSRIHDGDGYSVLYSGYLQQKADRDGACKAEDKDIEDSGTSTSRPSKRVA
ncbi:cryptochrome-1-like isoform X2 [Phragmites australis]|uniref:cryptochrome-1-like isoform X2 n=1 Tax=Phragmites australis TaxID=29695 RepID=UPI002D79F025|nr:cryptochrome-1-like isoform X2 [Phragmites australis]